ncbi:MAG TPA: hypothetical protein VG796_03475 [Verrucomicrobiales bacterium]|jgi:hypothetical protein|nr:hypothetical protein [Verrucomicrobiales bacterium]
MKPAVLMLSGVVLLAWVCLLAAFGVNSGVPLVAAAAGVVTMTPVALFSSAAVFKMARDPLDQPGRWRAVRSFHRLTFLMPILAAGFFVFVSQSYKRHSNPGPSASGTTLPSP